MDEKLKEKIYKILDDTPTECSWLDYKEFPYERDRLGKFIKLLNGFLNSIDGYQKDKFIIIGIDDNKNKKGLTSSLPMQDDKLYQDLADKISPRPSLETGTFEYFENGQKLQFGYIHIPADKNDDRIYTINSDYPDESTYINDIKSGNRKKPRVYASTAWIRKGSVLRPLSEEDRRNIYELNNINKTNRAITSLSQLDLSEVDLENKIMRMSILVGGWDENNENDKKIITELIGFPYKNIVSYLRRTLKEDNNILIFQNDMWKFDNRLDLIKMFSCNYFKEDIIAFQNISIKVLSSINPKFDLPSNKRMMASVYEKNPEYSNLLQLSISETLPMISSIYNDFKNCKDTIQYLPYKVIDSILNATDWRLWASLEKYLPLLAEAEPNLFLKKLETQIVNEPKMIEELMTSSELHITNNYYTTGLFWSLQLIAWQKRYIVSVCVILAQLYKYDKKAVDTIAGILLPWFPQTLASIETRKTAVENVLKENQSAGWELLMELMPNKRTIGSPSYKPKWNNIVPEKEDDVLKIDYWKQTENYLELALKTSKTDVQKLIRIIDLLDDVPKYMFDKIIKKLSQKSIRNLADEKKYCLWDKLEDFINRHLKYVESDWSLPKNLINNIKNLSKLLKPKSLLVYNRRYFKRDSWALHDERLSYSDASKKLNDYRVKVLKTIYKGGLEQIIEFAENVEDSYVVGFCFADVLNDLEQENILLSCLDSKDDKLCLFAKGFVSKKYYTQGDDWLNQFNVKKWNTTRKVNLLVMLPLNNNTLKLVTNYLGNEENYYWKMVDIRDVEKESNINYFLTKLLEVERADTAIDIISYAVMDKFDYDKKLAIKALNDMLSMQEKLNSLSSHNIQEIIKDLQQSNVSKDDMFKVEWSYLVLLNDIDCSPLTIEKELSENPKVYLEILEMIYKPHSVAKEDYKFVDEKIASNAYRVLHQWKMPPGLNEDNRIDKIKLNKWYQEMKKLCKESDRLEVGLLKFGEVLYYSPEDKSGLWIDKSVAEILNAKDSETIRRGFNTESYNSLGVVSIDENGKIFDDLADKYESKAKSIEKAGYSRIAVIMRELSDSYRSQAERTRERYLSDDD